MTTLQARLYEMLHRGNSGDDAYYRAFCRGAARVLELGVGYGRLAIPIARDGAHVTGVDIDEDILGIAREHTSAEPDAVRRRLTWRCADMTTVSLEERFERIIIPYNSLCCLLRRDDVVAALSTARDHLAGGGRIAFDVYDAEDIVDEHDDEPIVALTHDGTLYTVYERSEWRRSERRLDTTYRFVAADDIVEHTIAQRYLLTGELRELIDEAGLAVVTLQDALWLGKTAVVQRQ